MGKNKLKKFADMASYGCVIQCPRDLLVSGGFPLKGRWNSDHFPESRPITLELGCGKGEYTVGLARRHPDRNFIGVDIKGARMWTGATAVEEENIANAAFLRTQIELIDAFFAPGEVSEIWITFPDPQLKKVNKRLTSTRFLGLYRNIMLPGGVVNLKTDSPFLYEYTRRLVVLNGLELLADTASLYSGEDSSAPMDIASRCLADGIAESEYNLKPKNQNLKPCEKSSPISALRSPLTEEARAIQTHYETQWLARGKTIKFLSFRIDDTPLTEPDVSDLEPDDYRAAPRFNPYDKVNYGFSPENTPLSGDTINRVPTIKNTNSN